MCLLYFRNVHMSFFTRTHFFRNGKTTWNALYKLLSSSDTYISESLCYEEHLILLKFSPKACIFYQTTKNTIWQFFLPHQSNFLGSDIHLPLAKMRINNDVMQYFVLNVCNKVRTVCVFPFNPHSSAGTMRSIFTYSECIQRVCRWAFYCSPEISAYEAT